MCLSEGQREKTTRFVNLFGNSQDQADREQGLQGMRHDTIQGWEGARSGKF